MTSQELREELDKQLEREKYEKNVSSYIRIKKLVSEADKNAELSERDVTAITHSIWGGDRTLSF